MAAGQRSGKRDLQILEAFEKGASLTELAGQYKLSRDRVSLIIRTEKLKIRFSPQTEYCKRRAGE